MAEYLRFKRMIAPLVIEGLFWLAVVFVVLGGLFQLTQNFIAGVLLIVVGPLVARIYAELLMVIFKINEAVQDIRDRKGAAPSAPAGTPPFAT